MGANTVQDWLIVCATFFGFLILLCMCQCTARMYGVRIAGQEDRITLNASICSKFVALLSVRLLLTLFLSVRLLHMHTPIPIHTLHYQFGAFFLCLYAYFPLVCLSNLSVMLLSELVRLCRLDARRRRMQKELCRAGIPLVSASSTTRPFAPTAQSASFSAVNVCGRVRTIHRRTAFGGCVYLKRRGGG